jgi:hypothetical protein
VPGRFTANAHLMVITMLRSEKSAYLRITLAFLAGILGSGALLACMKGGVTTDILLIMGGMLFVLFPATLILGRWVLRAGPRARRIVLVVAMSGSLAIVAFRLIANLIDCLQAR